MEKMTTFRPIKIVVHHSGESDLPDLDFLSISRYHIIEKGWAWVGYHYVIEFYKNQAIAIPSRPLFLPGAHCKGENTTSIGICFVGNFSKSETLVNPHLSDILYIGAGIIASILAFYAISLDCIYPHSKFSATECPGLLFPLPTLKNLAYNLYRERYSFKRK